MNSAFTTIDKDTTWIQGDLNNSLEVTLIVWRMGNQCFVEAFSEELDAHGRYSDLELENMADSILFIGPHSLKD